VLGSQMTGRIHEHKLCKILNLSSPEASQGKATSKGENTGQTSL
jgi:hypothetical protein